MRGFQQVREYLHTYADVPAEAVEFFQENGYVKLKNILDADVLSYMRDIITTVAKEHNTQSVALEDRDTYGKAFLQIMNLWKHSSEVKDIVLSQRLGKIAADLLEVEGVRLYHDQALFKESGGGHTPWHVDQYYWPLSSDRCVTCWIPLQAVPLDMGPLEFSAGSAKHINIGRDIHISDESEAVIEAALAQSACAHIREAYDIGEVSFHAGWTYHRAGANTTSNMRNVMTIIYMDRDMRLVEPKNAHQQADWDTWCPGARIGDIIDTPLNPIIYERCDV